MDTVLAHRSGPTSCSSTPALNDNDRPGRSHRRRRWTTWSALNSTAQQHGLLGLAGSHRPCGHCRLHLRRRRWMADPPLRHGQLQPLAVDYVDGHRAAATSRRRCTDPVDREACGMFRSGGGGVGIATRLTLEPGASGAPASGGVPPGRYRLAGHRRGRVQWVKSAARCPDISVFTPGRLRCFHLQVPSRTGVRPPGPDAAALLPRALRDAPAPRWTTFAPADAARLAQVHLDPPNWHPQGWCWLTPTMRAA